MAYVTLGEALYWLEEPTGKTVKDNRCELVEMLNRIRRHFYLLYQDVPLFMDGEECIIVDEYPLDCNCKESYLGITLRPEYETVEAIWKNDIPIRMFDKWREYREGIKHGCGCKLKMYDVETNFPTERELAPCGDCSFVKFKAEDPRDKGKIVMISFYDSAGQEFTEEIELQDHYVKTSKRVMRIKPRGGIVLPPGRCGSVTVADEKGRILSLYDQSESVPAYRRMKIEGVCCGDQVYIKASRKFRALYFDHDVIETDNRLAIEECARYFFFNNSTRADIQYESKSAIHAANTKHYLLGEKSRHRGKATISEVRINHGPVNQSGLASKRGSVGGRYYGGGRARR